MPDHIDELCALVEEAGGTMRLHGVPVSPPELRQVVVGSVIARLAAAVTPSLPVPRLSATVYPPMAKGMYGAVVVTLGGRVRDPDESQRYTSRRDPARGPVRCTICGTTGHARSNRKFHPRRAA